MSSRPLVLMILDGWGSGAETEDNAISLANPENFLTLQSKYPHTLLTCSGIEVGLPSGQMGNSEVGHLNIGAGRVVYQEITRISKAIEDGSFFSNPELIKAFAYAKKNQGAIHFMGLLSDGGVHSHLSHLFALLDMAQQQQMREVYIHAFLDGRDVGPKTAQNYIIALEDNFKQVGLGKIATLGGRFYGMDRDNRWDRIEKAYQAMVLGQGNKAANAFAAIQDSYEARISDEFVEPVVIIDEKANPVGTVKDQDAVIFFNFRADRARQITRAFVDPELNTFPREVRPQVHFVCMTQYDVDIIAPVAFTPQNLDNTLGEVLAAHQLRQLRIAETEKYAHVTFFFNGGVEEPNPGEDRVLIPSPKIETYNLKPEMSAIEVTERVIKEIRREYYDVIIINYANPDMVGHTGVLPAAIQAIKTVDWCLMQVVKEVLKFNGIVIITADHGNCEMMLSPENGSPYTAHTTNQVPFVLVSNDHLGNSLRENGSLEDIAPTILELLGIAVPKEMTGRSLVEKAGHFAELR